MLAAWLKKPGFNSRISEVEGKLSSVSGVATNTELTAAENKTPDV